MMFLRRRTRAAAGLIWLGLATAVSVEAQAPPSPSAQEQAAIKVQQTGDWSQALVAFEALAKAEPSNPRAVFGLGAALHETGKPAEAIPVFQRAQGLGYQPVNQVRFRLARAFAKVGDKPKALAEIEGLAAAGFTNLPLMQNPDLASLKGEPQFDAAVRKISSNARPCEADPNFRKFDFWVGEWDVQQTGVPRAPVGASSRIERILGGCVIQENWEPGAAGPAGKSFNVYNTMTKKWEQYWVDATGRITHYFGEFRDDGNLYYEADQGPSTKVRMTFFNQGADQVRQLGHLSTDAGKTWSVSFDLTYIRKK